MRRQASISFLAAALLAATTLRAAAAPRPTAYYIDSRQGDDRNSGADSRHPWKTLARLERAALLPGDSLRCKRGSSFTGPLQVRWSGEEGRYITITDYGRPQDPAPAFTNPVFRPGNYGNCIRIGGSYVIVEHLFCSATAACTDIPYGGSGWLVWEMGAIHIDSAAAHCIVRDNEIKDCVAGIRSDGPYALITHNYIHDCHRVLKQWNWGPIGIWLGADHQEVSYNRVFGYSAVDPRIGWGPDSYGSGADGGAMEIDDARYNKSDIDIHHNYTRDCQGFLEVTWTDVKKNPLYRGFHIHHNVSDDYQQFVALWCGEGCLIDHNTIVRRKKNANDWGVFNITQRNGRNTVRDNIVVTEKNIVVFNTGRKGTAKPHTLIAHNLYFAAADSLLMGKEGPGDSAVFADPRLLRYRDARRREDYAPAGDSPAAGDGPAIGALEYRRDLTLADNGKARLAIRLPAAASATERFAAQELSRYLMAISGAAFAVDDAPATAAAAIRLAVDTKLPVEDYRIAVQGRGLLLAGGSGRAVLYAVYDLLHRLGCVWAAPALSYYNGRSEYVPRRATLVYRDGNVYEHPRLAYRKLDIEEGRTHTVDNLRQMIDWMPKVRLNVLMAPLNYQGEGRVQWDSWRQALAPDIAKRDLLVEVGGHGYQNFLNAGMEGGRLFREHPGWFGRNRRCEPDSLQNLVFNTADPDAVAYFIGNIIAWLRRHPEVAIFDCWPPDVAKWAECPAMAAPGAAADRQALLVNQVDSAIRAAGLPVRLEVIAYGQVLLPPQQAALHANVLVDVCPINQSFERQLYDSAATNIAYAAAIRDWRRRFAGDIGLYSYYRKYAWRSLPVVIPAYIQKDLQWCAGLPLQGVSSYAEPGDWCTYEPNHYALAALAWEPEADLDLLMNEWAAARYGAAAHMALAALRRLGQTMRRYGSIPYTTLKPAAELAQAEASLRESLRQVTAAAKAPRYKTAAAALQRLALVLQYGADDISLLRMRAAGSNDAALRAGVKKLVGFLQRHAADGVFVLYRKNNEDLFLKHYNSIR